MRAKDVMTQHPVCCHASDSAQSVAKALRDEDIGSLPVVADGDSRRLVGIITDRDSMRDSRLRIANRMAHMLSCVVDGRLRSGGGLERIRDARKERTCPSGRLNESSPRSRRWKARECICAVRLASAILPTSIPFFCSMTSAMTFRKIIWRVFPGIRTAASRPLPTSWPEPWSTATAWEIAAPSAAGDVQWMTAGSGIIHQEMPKGDHAGRMHGFQLWANLPSSLKMTAPRYQEVKSRDIAGGQGR